MPSTGSRRRNDRSTVYIGLLALAVALLGYLYAASFRQHPEPVRRINSTPPGVEAVEVDPTLADIQPALPAGETGGAESFDSMMERLKPEAAINGTFYDENMKPLGDIVINGKIANRGHYPNAMAVKGSGEVVFLRSVGGRLEWSGFNSGLAAGPRLVHAGKVALTPNEDGFTKRCLEIEARRSGVGLTAEGKVLLVTAANRITLAEFADMMIELGAVEAMNLDGGGASGLYLRGKTLTRPGLPMTNVLAIYPKSR